MNRRFEAPTLPGAFYETYKNHPQDEVFFTKTNGQWEPQTYKTSFEYVCKLIAGLKRLGFSHGQKAIIFAENRYEWILTDYAIQWLGGCTAAIYTTSTDEQIKYISDDAEGTVFFVSNEEMLKGLKDVQSFETVKHIVSWEHIEDPKLPAGVSYVSPNEFLKEAVTEEEAAELLKAVKAEDLSMLLYTSGTTGEPKGVMLTQHNLVSDIHMMQGAFPSFRPGLVALSFLPLSHIYERSLSSTMILARVKIYFAESMDKLVENMAEVQPQMMTAVPRIFEKIYAKITDKVKSAPAVRKKIFSVGLAYRR